LDRRLRQGLACRRGCDYLRSALCCGRVGCVIGSQFAGGKPPATPLLKSAGLLELVPRLTAPSEGPA